MIATINEIKEISLMVNKLWPKHSIEDLTKIAKE